MGYIASSANRIGNLASKIIKDNKGKICSVFSKAIALQYDDFAVYISDDLFGQPFAINVDHLPRTYAKEELIGEDVSWHAGSLWVSDGRWRIDLEEAMIWDEASSLPYIDTSRKQIDKALGLVKKELIDSDKELGFAILAKDLWGDGSQSPRTRYDQLYKGTLETILSIRESLKSQDGMKTIESMKRIVGLGAGLTPSGDDFITGLLLILQSIKSRDEDHNKFVNELLVQSSRQLIGLTNIFGWSYIYGASQGYGAEVLFQAIEELLTEENRDANLHRLAQIGGTSGCDTIVGIGIGLEYFLNQQD